jgi:hypothetical protein
VAYAATFVGESLAEKHQLKGCLLDSNGVRLEGESIVASASAACDLQGRRVYEVLTLRFTPRVEG